MKTVTKDKERHFIMKKSVNASGNITIINTHAPNNRASKYMKEKN